MNVQQTPPHILFTSTRPENRQKRRASEDRIETVFEELFELPLEKNRRSGAIKKEESARLIPQAISRGTELGNLGTLPFLSNQEQSNRDQFLEALHEGNTPIMTKALSSITTETAFHILSSEGVETVSDFILDQLITRFKGDALGTARALANTGVFRPVLARIIQKAPVESQKSLSRHVASLLMRAAATSVAEEFFSFLPPSLQPHLKELHQIEQNIDELTARLSKISVQ